MKTNLIFCSALSLVFIITAFGCTNQNSQKKLMSQVDKLLVMWNTGNFDGVEDILTEDFEIRMSPLYEPEKGIEAFKASVIGTRESYSDFKIVIDESFLSGEVGSGRWTIYATSKSGTNLVIPGMSILHFEDGKIRDEWISNNDLLWLQQLNYTIYPPDTALK